MVEPEVGYSEVPRDVVSAPSAAETVDRKGSEDTGRYSRAGSSLGEIEEGEPLTGSMGETGLMAPPAPRPKSQWPQIPGFAILDELGRGGMGVVYKALQVDLNRFVALKMIRSGAQAGAEEQAHFRREAETLAQLRQPNIVQIYQVGEHAGQPYLALEFVEGGSLAKRMAGKPQPPGEGAQLMESLARAMHAAHERGVIHRDLKPANILLARDGSPKITDFGLAKRLEGDQSLTASGDIMGTPHYMAPEQAGQTKALGPPADIYALGVILYEMLTGRPPFVGITPMETLWQVMAVEPTVPSSLQPKVPRDLEIICLKCLRKESARRYGSALELAEDLRRFLTREPIHARPVGQVERAWKWTKRHPAKAVALAMGVFAALAVVVGVFLYAGFQQQRANFEGQRARNAEQELAERVRLEKLSKGVPELLRRGQAAIARQDWNQANVELTSARDQCAAEPELKALHEEADQLLRHIALHLADQEKHRQFDVLRHEALFHATLFTGVPDLAYNLNQTRANAQQALSLFGIRWDEEGPPVLVSPFLAAERKQEILSGCYELVLISAEAVAQTLPKDTPKEQKQRTEEALSILQRAATLGPVTQAYYLRRARYLDRLANQAEADQERARAAQFKLADAVDYFLLGDERFRQGRFEEAAAAFENVLQVQPNHFWGQYFLAICYLKGKRYGEGQLCLTASIGRRPDFVWAYLLRGFCQGELASAALARKQDTQAESYFDHAEADFAKAAELDPNEQAAYGLHVNRGVMRLRRERLDDAIADLERAIALRPKHFHAYANLAQALEKKGRWADALAQLNTAIDLEPEQAVLYRLRGHVHIKRQDPEAALLDLERASQKDLQEPPNVTAAEDYLECARLWHGSKEYQKSLAALTQAGRYLPADTVVKKQFPQLAEVHRLHGDVLIFLKRNEEAVAAYQHYLKFDPENADVYRALGRAHVRLGKVAQAVDDFTVALRFQPDPVTFTTRGWLHVSGEVFSLKLALHDFTEALRLNPSHGDALGGRAYVQAKLGLFQHALTDAEEALRLTPAAPRSFYNAARVYALAAGKPAAANDLAELQRKAKCQERAVELIRRTLDLVPALEKQRFWHEFIQTDSDLAAIRNSPEFTQLAAAFGKTTK